MRNKKLLLLICLTLTGLSSLKAQSLMDPSHLVPVAKHLSAAWKADLFKNERKPYTGEELNTIGMPCGGIAAGQLYVRGDGTLANWWIANNAYNTGYGLDKLMNFNTTLGPWKVCYQTFEPLSYIDQGFAITVKQAGKTTTKTLDKKGFDNISFIGEYPIATINYASKTKPLPVAVSMEVFSPFIPLNARESATPGTILKFTLKNSSKVPAEVSLTGWLQNLVCLDLKGKVSGMSNNQVVKEKNLSGIFMTLAGASDSLQKHPYYGNVELSVLSDKGFADADYKGSNDHQSSITAKQPLGEKLLGSVGTNILLKAGEQKEVTFLLTWYFPNRPVPRDVDWDTPLSPEPPLIGNKYRDWFGSSMEVTAYLQKNIVRLSAQTHLFHDTYYQHTTLPYWLNQRLLMSVSTLATETSQWWADDKFWAWEGVGSCFGTCTHVYNYAQAMAHLFPELERNVREKTDFGTSFHQDGSIEARNGQGGILIDGHAGAILKAYREYLNSDNALFLARNWNRIKRAMQFIITQDENGDGLIEKEQANTYDIAFHGANTYVGSLYLASLKAASKMAALMQDQAFKKTCDSIFNNGRQNTVKKIWNGAYFFQDVDLVKHPDAQYGNGCLSDQLFGQTWAHLNHEGYIYPEDKVKTALKSIWKYNWALDVGVQTSKHKPERVYADPGEAGLLICTWPQSPHMGEHGVRYRDEVWTGIEYQVATNMIYEGMIEEGLSIVKGVNDRYAPQKHNPWNEIECGDHYARAMASWGVLLALEDFYYNGPQKTIGFSPKIQKDNFEAFFTGAKGWGNISQKRNNGQQTNTIKVAYGHVTLKQIELEALNQVKSVEVKLGTTIVPCHFETKDDKVVVTFKPQKVNAGEHIFVTLTL